MTLDKHPKRWRQMAKLFLLWLQLPDEQANHLIDVLPKSEQDRFDAFILMLKSPQKALKVLETYTKRGEFETVDTLIEKLPRIELEKLVKAGLKRGKLVDNLSSMNVEELRELLFLCSYPKSFLVYFLFIDGLDHETKELLLA